MTPEISIIIPVYNIEKYLCKCIDSIIAQDFKDLEIILVDDGSQDNSPAICDKYAITDKRIKVIHQKNSGVSKARNAGINAANGRYIMFVDGDDWLEKDTCKVVYNIATEHDADVVMFACMNEYKNKTLHKHAFRQDFLEFKGSECGFLHRRHAGMIGKELENPEKQDYLCTVWGKLYKKDIIIDNKLFFVDLSKIGSYEDGLFNLNYFKYINKAIYIKRYLYHYRKDNETSNTSNYKANLTDSKNNLISLIKQYIELNELPYEFQQGLDNRVALSIIGLGLNAISSNKNIFEKVKEIKQILSTKQYRNAVKQLQINYMPLHWKMFFICAKINFASAVYLLLIIITKLRQIRNI